MWWTLTYLWWALIHGHCNWFFDYDTEELICAGCDKRFRYGKQGTISISWRL